MRVTEGENQAVRPIEAYANAVSHGWESNPVLASAFSRAEFGRRMVRLKYASEADEYHFCLQHLTWLALGKFRTAEQSGVKKLAKNVLDYWIADTCPACLGRGSIPIPDTPHLAGELCTRCVDGVRSWSASGAWSDRGAELLDRINAEVAKFARQMGYLMSNRS